MDKVFAKTQRTVVIAGRSFIVAEPNLGDVAKIAAAIKDRPLKELARLRTEGILDDDVLYRTEVSAALARQREDKRDSGSIMGDAIRAGDFDVVARLFLASVRKSAPDLTLDQVQELPIEELMFALSDPDAEGAAEGEPKK